MIRQNTPPILPAPNLHGQRVRAVLVGETAYVVGLPQLVAEPRVIQVTPCVDSGNVLIAREVYENTLVPGAANEVASELQLVLYSARRRRCTVVFRYRPNPGERPRLGKFFWWVGGEYASFSLHLSTLDSSQRVVLPLLLSVPEEKVLPLKLDLPKNANGFHVPSPTRPFALFVLAGNSTQPGRVYRIHPDGSAQVIRQDDLGIAFLPDGETTLVRRENDKGELSYTLFNVLTAMEKPITAESAAALEQKEVGQAARDESLEAQLPLKLVLRETKGEPSVPLLYLAPQKAEGGEETLLLGDAEPAGISRDLRAVFYYQQGLLYFVPLQPMPRQAFLQGRDKELRELTFRRAKQLMQNVLMSYFANHQETWPAPGTSLDELFKEPGVQRDLGLAQNPRTGRDDLRFEYNGTSEPQGAGTRVASLGGPGGRVVIFGDGHLTWEPGR